MSAWLRAAVLTVFRVGERLGAPLTAARRAGAPRGNPLPELKWQAYDVAHAIRCWDARRRHLAPGALSAVAEGARDLTAQLTSGWTTGNEVRLHTVNSRDFARRLALLAEARHCVACAFWSLRDDAVGRQFVAALGERVRAGVAVRLVLDANIIARFTYLDPNYAAFIQTIRDTGVELVALEPPRPWLNTHRKLFVVDGAVALVGGRNIGLPYATEGDDTFLDTDVEVAGPAAMAVHRLVAELAGLPAPPVPEVPASGHDRVAILDQPARLNPVDDALVRALVAATYDAQETIDLAFGYIILAPALAAALAAAHARGVAVRVLTNSRVTNDYPYWEGAAFGSLDPLVRAGVPLFRMRTQTLHAKFAVFDRHISTVGSHNLWTLSTLHDAETNLVIDSPSLGAELTELFDRLAADAEPADPATWSVPDDRSLRLANALIWAWGS